jgi:hypothetical protein
MPDTPFEELEYLVDYLPEEGESILVTRRNGELQCEASQALGHADPIEHPVLYGMLVQMNERLAALCYLPASTAILVWFGICSLTEAMSGIGLPGWYLYFGLGLLSMFLSIAWVEYRQRQLFNRELFPQLVRKIRGMGLDHYSVVGSLRHHSELRTLFRQLAQFPM